MMTKDEYKKKLLQAYIQGKRDEPVWYIKWEDLPFVGKYRRIKRFLKWFEKNDSNV